MLHTIYYNKYTTDVRAADDIAAPLQIHMQIASGELVHHHQAEMR